MKKITLLCLFLFCFACRKEAFEWYFPFAYSLRETQPDIHYYYINDNNKLSEVPASGTFRGFEESCQDAPISYKLTPQSLKFADKDKVDFSYSDGEEITRGFTAQDSIINIEIVDIGTGRRSPLFDFKLIQTDSNSVWLEQGFFKARYSFRKKKKQKYGDDEGFSLLQPKPLAEAMKIWKAEGLQVKDTIAIYTIRYRYQDD
jgi:hypothetical protein